MGRQPRPAGRAARSSWQEPGGSQARRPVVAPRWGPGRRALEAAAGGAPGSAPLRLTSRRLILSAEADRAAGEVLAPRGGQPTLVFLANALTTVGPAGETPATIPYSTVLGVASMSLPSGALVGADGGDHR